MIRLRPAICLLVEQHRRIKQFNPAQRPIGGRHREKYHKHVYDKLRKATAHCSPGSPAFKAALKAELKVPGKQCAVVEAILPEDKVRPDRRGRPWSDRRTVLNGMLWILRTGAPWQDLPPRYGSYQTAHRRFQNWVRSGVIEKILLALAQHVKDAGGLDLKECFVDGTFVPAKKGGAWPAKPSGEKAPKSWALQTAMVYLSPCGQKVLRQLK